MPENDNTEVAVTGATAISIDFSDKLGDALLPYLALVVGLAFLLLMLVFRSLLVPLKATLGFLLTVAATFGAVVAVFQWGWLAGLFGIEGQTGPVISMLPIFLVGVVFGLAMDYQIFLVTRMREEHVHGAEPRAAVVDGFAHGARVVTAAAVIMIAVFSGFILSSQTLIREMGFGLALAVAIDAFVVRMTIVPPSWPSSAAPPGTSPAGSTASSPTSTSKANPSAAGSPSPIAANRSWSADRRCRRGLNRKQGPETRNNLSQAPTSCSGPRPGWPG